MHRWLPRKPAPPVTTVRKLSADLSAALSEVFDGVTMDELLPYSAGDAVHGGQDGRRSPTPPAAGSTAALFRI